MDNTLHVKIFLKLTQKLPPIWAGIERPPQKSSHLYRLQTTFPDESFQEQINSVIRYFFYQRYIMNLIKKKD